MAAERINPAYYANQAGLECIDVIERFGLPFCRSNALKYLWRHKQKNGKEDLVKALWYLDREVSGPQRLPAALRPVDYCFRGLAWLRRQLCAFAVDRDLLAAACGVAGRERVALLEICCGDAKVARSEIERIIAEQYPQTMAGDAAPAPSVVTQVQAEAAIAALSDAARVRGLGFVVIDDAPPLRVFPTYEESATTLLPSPAGD